MNPALAWRIARIVIPGALALLTAMLVLFLEKPDFIGLIIAGGLAVYSSRRLIPCLHTVLLLRDMRRKPHKYTPQIITGEVPPLDPEFIETSKKLTELGAESIGAVMNIGAQNRQLPSWYFAPMPITWIAQIISDRTVRILFRTIFQNGATVVTIRAETLKSGNHIREPDLWVSTSVHSISETYRIHQHLSKAYQTEYNTEPMVLSNFETVIENVSELSQKHFNRTSHKTMIYLSMASVDTGLMLLASILLMIFSARFSTVAVTQTLLWLIIMGILIVGSIIYLFRMRYVRRNTPPDIAQMIDANALHTS